MRDAVMRRCWQLVLIVSTLLLCWLGFQIVHELGHVAAAWLTGGSVVCVALHPLQISWSAFAPNPHPQAVAWGGPVLGALLPIALLVAVKKLRVSAIYLFQFFAGFCLVANGFYLLVDGFERSGDGGTLLRHGAAQWQLAVFAAMTVPCGFWLWHGLGPHFGLGAGHGAVSRRAAVGCLCALAAVVGLELLCCR